MAGARGLRSFSWLSGWRLHLSLVLVGILGTAVESLTLDVAQGEEGCVVINAQKGDTINGNYEVLTPRSLKGVMVVIRRSSDAQLLYKKTGLGEDYMWVEATEAGDYELCFLNGATDAMAKLENKDIDKANRLTGLDALRHKKQQEEPEEAKKKKEKAKDSDEDISGGYSERLWDGYGMSSSISDDFDTWYSPDPPTTTFGFGLRLGEGPDLEAMTKDSEEAEAERFLKDEANLLVVTLSMFSDHESYMRGREEGHRENMSKTSSRLMWCTLIEAAVLVWVSWSQLSYIRRFFETKRIL